MWLCPLNFQTALSLCRCKLGQPASYSAYRLSCHWEQRSASPCSSHASCARAGMHQSPSHHCHPHNLTPWFDTRHCKSICQGRSLCRGHQHIPSALGSLSGSGTLPFCPGATLVWHVPGICNYLGCWLTLVAVVGLDLLFLLRHCGAEEFLPELFSLCYVASGVTSPWEAAGSCCAQAGCWSVQKTGLWLCGFLGFSQLS